MHIEDTCPCGLGTCGWAFRRVDYRANTACLGACFTAAATACGFAWLNRALNNVYVVAGAGNGIVGKYNAKGSTA